ncbi:MAG: hypothetical protein US89_C0009G0044 [Candidatus Peregrinibacteria bacterium GW2011_GWF2_38_29]|nr:MAG: hypothetical protein US89_C0009G0044 [Candidatus Peregrinibacteria bacterium GW2011_GWF2_38_29]
MLSLFTKKSGNRDNYDLEKILFTLEKPGLSKSAKSAMKSHILANIKAQEMLPQHLDNFAQNIAKVSATVKMSSYVKSLIKNQILERIESTSEFRWVYQYKFAFKRALSAGLAVLIIATGAFSFIPGKENVVFAKPSTVLTEITGDVSVVRNEKEIKAENGFILYQDDVIYTRIGAATIKYFDGSISRLNENTKIKFSRLDTDEFGINTAIELDVDHGQMWAMVFDLFGNSLFKVRANKTTADVVDRATFSFIANKNSSEVDVYHNVVDVSVGSNGNSDTKTVLKGYKAVVNSNYVSLVSKKTLKQGEKEWINDNLKKDKEYIARVANEQTKLASDPVSDLKEDASLYLSFSDTETLRLKLNLADNKMALASSLMNAGKIDDARQTLSYLKDVVSEAKAKIDELKSSNPEEAAKMESLVNERLMRYKKDLSFVTPDLPLYEVKDSIRDMEMSVADNDESKVKLMFEKASSKLLEAQDLLDNKKFENAKANLEDLKVIIADMQKADFSKNPEMAKEVLNKNADIVKMLTLIENSLESSDLKKEVASVKSSSVQTIMDTAVQANGEKSAEDVNTFVRIYDQLGPSNSTVEEGDDVDSPKINLFHELDSSDKSNN